MTRTIFSIFVMALIFVFSAQADAALKSAKDQGEADPRTFYNPKEDPLDLELPMPNGLKFVLRAVAVPVSRLLDDTSFKMGLSAVDPGRSVYEKQRDGHIGAPFLLENLPDAWKKKLAATDKGANFAYYFIGKYELSNGQWDAVMGSGASEAAEDGKSKERGDLPKTSISWYDIQNFLSKYNEWLLANHSDKLPKIDGVPAFLRLPTEAEWEFAARGGNPGLPSEGKDFIDNEGHGDGVKVEDYAIFGLRHENASPIGKLKPNILGIYDMAGNVSELVGDGFRFTISDAAGGGGHFNRLHGSEGGFLSKGGSYRAESESEVYPGRRVEVPLFVKKGNNFVPSGDSSMGARLALASLNVPSHSREKSILAEETRQGKDAPVKKAQVKAAGAGMKPKGEKVVIDPTGDPVAELEKIYAATQSEDVKSNLKQLQALLQDQNEAYSRERDSNLMNNLTSVAYMAESLANIAFRCFELDTRYESYKNQLTDEKKSKYLKQINSRFKTLKNATQLYRKNVSRLGGIPKKNLAIKISQIKDQYPGDERINKNFRAILDSLQQHIALVKKNGTGSLSDIMIWDQVIPGKETLKLLHRLNDSQDKKSTSNNGEKSKKQKARLDDVLQFDEHAKNFL